MSDFGRVLAVPGRRAGFKKAFDKVEATWEREGLYYQKSEHVGEDGRVRIEDV